MASPCVVEEYDSTTYHPESPVGEEVVMDRGERMHQSVALLVVLAGLLPAYRGEAQQPIPAPTISSPIHDTTRTQPRVVDPGPMAFSSRAPSDAIVLFDGRDASEWRTQDGGASRWKIEKGYLEVVGQTGGISTARAFGDCQLHIEWASPAEPVGAGQARGNSGVFLMGRYEVQVLDSYRNSTYPDDKRPRSTGSIRH